MRIPAHATPADGGVAPPGRSLRTVLGVVAALALIVGVAALVIVSGPQRAATTTTTTMSSTYIASSAGSILAGAEQGDPAGFTPKSNSTTATESGWAELQNLNDGSSANLTAIVYASDNGSQGYYERFVASVSGEPGWSKITSYLSSFEGYGSCYGYGEDVDSLAVVNGVCTKGNVFLEVHLASSASFSDLENDLTVLMGALYQSAA